jgi:hypothetical protein
MHATVANFLSLIFHIVKMLTGKPGVRKEQKSLVVGDKVFNFSLAVAVD